MNIGENIKKYRKLKGLKQSELSELSSISRVAIGNYERGERTPNIDIVKQIANALDVSIQELVTEEPYRRSHMNIGENLKVLRKIKKLSQQDLGNKLGVSGAYIQQIENNKKNPSIKTFNKIANALEVSLDELLIGKKQLSEFTTEELIKELYKRTLR